MLGHQYGGAGAVLQGGPVPFTVKSIHPASVGGTMDGEKIAKHPAAGSGSRRNGRDHVTTHTA